MCFILIVGMCFILIMGMWSLLFACLLVDVWCACRGLRVRMGMHSGMDNLVDVQHSTVSHRVIYSGGWADGCSMCRMCQLLQPGIPMPDSSVSYQARSLAMFLIP